MAVDILRKALLLKQNSVLRMMPERGGRISHLLAYFLHRLKMLRVMLFSLVACAMALNARSAPIRVTFHNNKESVDATAGVLRESGADDVAIDGFVVAAHYYNLSSNRMDVSAFPEPKNGFYEFPSGQAFAEALPHRLCDAQHDFELNCFMTLLILTHGRLSSDLDANEMSGPFLAPSSDTNGPPMRIAATPADALDISYPPDYLAWYSFVTRKEWTASLTSLNTLLYSYLVMPRSCSTNNLAECVLLTIRHEWERRSMSIQAPWAIVLLHRVNPQYHLILTDHCGLLISRAEGYTYIEKSGGQGPYVRIDVSDVDDLLPYFQTIITKEMAEHYSRNFVSVNGERIYAIAPWVALQDRHNRRKAAETGQRQGGSEQSNGKNHRSTHE